MDIGKFIQLIRLHKSIWNVSDKLYSNRIKRTKDIALNFLMKCFSFLYSSLE